MAKIAKNAYWVLCGQSKTIQCIVFGEALCGRELVDPKHRGERYLLHKAPHQAEPQTRRQNIIVAVEVVAFAVVKAASNCRL